MNTTDCAYEQQVLAAERKGSWTESLKQHYASCINCQESVRLASSLKSYARETILIQRQVPNHRLIFLRSALSRKQETLSLFDAITLFAMVGVSFAGIVAGILWKLPLITTFLADCISTTLQAVSDVQLIGMGWLIGIGCMIITILLAAQYFLVTEEWKGET